MNTKQSAPEALQLAGGVTWGCRQIGISRTKFYELIKSGDIRTFTVGGRRLVRREDIEAFLERMAANAA